MKTLIIYDSLYGNTEKIAKSIGAGLIGDVAVLPVHEVTPFNSKTVSLLVVGSPVHGGKPTPAIEAFLKGMPPELLRGVNVAAFDTRFAAKDQGIGIRLLMKVIGYAAPRIAQALVNKGGKLIAGPEGFIVERKDGPLKPGEIERATTWLTTAERM